MQAACFDEMAVLGSYRIAIGAALFDAGAASPLGGVVQTDHHLACCLERTTRRAG
jgi:hypothetical protein